MKKRANGLYQKKVPVGKVDGKYRYVYVYGKTLIELAEKEREVLRSVGPLTSKSSFGEITKRMLKLDETHLCESDFNMKSFRIEQMSKHFKDKTLDEITIEDINAAMLEIYAVNPSTGRPSAKRTIMRYLDSVSSVFEYGIRTRITTYNPVQYVHIPKNAPVKKRNALTREQRNIILSQTDIRYIPAQIFILTGLRRGELTALTWGDINFKEGYISVTKSYDYKAKTIKGTKTEAGERNVPITEPLYPILERLKNNYLPIAKYNEDGTLKKTRKIIKPIKPRDDDFVITGETSGMMSEKGWLNLLDGLVQELGFKFDWHSLRHTYASILYEAGVDTLTAKDLLGHSDVKTTIGIYTHLSERGKKISIDKLDEFLKNDG